MERELDLDDLLRQLAYWEPSLAFLEAVEDRVADDPSATEEVWRVCDWWFRVQTAMLAACVVFAAGFITEFFVFALKLGTAIAQRGPDTGGATDVGTLTALLCVSLVAAVHLLYLAMTFSSRAGRVRDFYQRWLADTLTVTGEEVA